jgi:hypothetical protein
MDILIRRLEERATQRIGELAAELVETPSDQREAVLAELEFEQWQAEYCVWCAQAR